MRHVHCERDSLPALAVLVPVRDDVTDQVGPVHPRSQLAFDVITGDRADATQIRIDRRVYPRPHQIAASDQLGDLRRFDQRFEDPTKAATVAAARRGRQPDQNCVGIAFDDFAVAARGRVMHFIDDQQPGRGQRNWHNGARVADPKGLDRGDLDVFECARLHSRLDDAVRDSVTAQFRAGLLDDFTTMRQHQRTAALLCNALDQGGCDHRLAATSWHHNDDAAPTGCDGGVNVSDHFFLEGVQRGHVAGLRVVVAKAAYMTFCTASSPTLSIRPDQTAAL